MCVGIVVEDIGHGESAHLQSQSRDVNLLGKLQFVGIQLLLLSSETPDLSEKNASNVYVAAELASFVGLGVWKGSQAVRFAEAESLVILGIKINFTAWPNTSCQKQIGLGCLTKVIIRIQTLGSAVGRMKSRLALEDFHRVNVDSPVLILTRILSVIDRDFASLSRLLTRGILTKAGNVLGLTGKLKQQDDGQDETVQSAGSWTFAAAL